VTDQEGTAPPPWAAYPYAQLDKARAELVSGDEEARRDALIRADRCVEAAVKAFASDPPRLRAGLVIPREQADKARGTAFPQKLEFLEWLFATKGRDNGRLIQELDYYHNLRNDAQHASTGFLPSTRQVRDAVDAAGRLLFELYGVEPMAGRPGERLQGTPAAQGPAMVVAVDGAKRREIPRQPSDPTPDPARGPGGVPARAPNDEPSASHSDRSADGLVGRRLGAVLLPVVRAIDRDRRGVSVRMIVDAAGTAGIVIGGREPRQVVRSALGLSNREFERLDRGLWTWSEGTDHDLGIAGDGLIEQALAAARRADPERAGIGYRDLLAVLDGAGVVVAGPDEADALWAALGSPRGRQSFGHVGPGLYVWLDPHDGAGHRGQNPAPRRGPADDGRSLALGGEHRRIKASFHEAVLDLDDDVAVEVDGPDLMYLVDGQPFLRAAQVGHAIELRGFIPMKSSPHLRGSVLYERSSPGRADGLAQTLLAPVSERDWRAGALLATAACANVRNTSGV
jgi:hypothetical protein